MVGENNKVVIVTGESSGIGRCTASMLPSWNWVTSAPDLQKHVRKAFSAMKNTAGASPGASVRWSMTSKTAWTRHALDGTSPVLWRKRTRQSFMLPAHSINS